MAMKTLDDMVAEVRASAQALIDDAYTRGVADGKAEAARSIYAAAGAILPQDNGLGGAVADTSVIDALNGKKRAPKGLTESVLRSLLHGPFGLTMEEAQRSAVEADSRIQPKTVYNELYRKTDIYEQDERGRWRLKAAAREPFKLLPHTEEGATG